MANTCSHDCGSCSQSCSSRTKPEDLHDPLKAGSSVKRVIGIISGKGGVGKSLVTALTACAMQQRGYRCAVLDADITGPSMPKLFGLQEKATGGEDGVTPVKSEGGIPIMSINLLLEDERAPVVWRGPLITGTVRQFWSEVNWGEIDYMFVDMPPGTGDVPLTVFQSLPLNGVIIVTTPQELVNLIVDKAANMTRMMNIPVIGLVENMSYVLCPHCGERFDPFGKSHCAAVVLEHSVRLLAQLPIDPALAQLCDSGNIEQADTSLVAAVADAVEAL